MQRSQVPMQYMRVMFLEHQQVPVLMCLPELTEGGVSPETLWGWLVSVGGIVRDLQWYGDAKSVTMRKQLQDRAAQFNMELCTGKDTSTSCIAGACALLLHHNHRAPRTYVRMP